MQLRVKYNQNDKDRATKPKSLELKSFHEWSRTYLAHHFPIADSGLHKHIDGQLAEMHKQRGSRKAWLAPRGSAKTTRATLAYPLYCICNGLENYIVLTSDTGQQAEKYLDAIKAELESNDKLRAAYPEIVGKGPVWRSDAIEARNGIRVEALGTGTKLRGRKHRQHRPTLIVVDDPQNTGHIVSELQRTRSWEWFTKDVCNAGSPATNIIVLGTALHQDCIICRLKQTAGWEWFLFRSIQDWPHRMDLWNDWESILFRWDDNDREAKAKQFYLDHKDAMKAGHKVLWPDRETLLDLMTKRAAIGPAAFLFEHQGEPTDPSMCEWPASFFARADFWFDRWPDDIIVRVLSLDPSKGKKDDVGDYSAIIRYGRDSKGVEYVEADLRRRPVDQIVADCVEHLRQFKPDRFAVEANTFQELLASPLREACRVQGVECPIILVNNLVNKLVRIRRLTEPLAQRKIRFRIGSQGTALAVEQLKQFPIADHDDGPDAIEMARRVAIDLFNKRPMR